MLNILTISGENSLQVTVFAYHATTALNKLYLPDFNAIVRIMGDNGNDMEFTLELSEGLPSGAKEFLKLQFSIWAKEELQANLEEFFIYSRYTEDITKIKFKVNILRKEL